MQNKINFPIYRQLKQIQDGGFPIFMKKLKTGFLFYGLNFFALLIILLMRIIRPWITIRWGRITSIRIGHFLGEIDMYLCQRNASDSQTFDILYYQQEICNQQIKKMWDRVFSTHPRLLILPPELHYFGQIVNSLNKKLPGSAPHVIPRLTRDFNGLRSPGQIHLSFTEEEKKQCWMKLNGMGVTENTPIVCFHARDNTYLNKTLSKKNWSYHDFRDSNIQNYFLAMEKLAKRGYAAFRVGAVVSEPLKTNNSRVIDYATNGQRTELLDLFLGANCLFFLCTTSGIFYIPKVFHRPVVMVDFIPLRHMYGQDPQGIVIPKKCWLKAEKRLLTFSEMLDLEEGLDSQLLEKLGIEAVDNTPEEIMAAAFEMEERIKGVWQTTEEDEELQNCFHNILKNKKLDKTPVPRIGSKFLAQNKGLLI